MGILLMDFIARRKLERGESLDRSVAITTIVSSAMADEVAEAYGFELRRVLTGFKYIGEQIAMLEAAGEAGRFMFGFEESYGYLAGTHVRDKDAVVASMLICQMARYYRARGMSLVDAMEALYERFGYCFNRTVSLAYPGADGAAKMADIMARVRPRGSCGGRRSARRARGGLQRSGADACSVRRNLADSSLCECCRVSLAGRVQAYCTS